MKTKKIFNVFMIAIAIATASIIAPSCDDEDDVMEVKYKTVKVESSEVYQTQDVVDVQITYNVVAEVSQGVERTESEWVNLIKKEINKEVNYVVKGLKFDDLSTEIFDDIYDSQNNKDYSLGVFKGISFVKIEKKDEDKKEIEEEDNEPVMVEITITNDVVAVESSDNLNCEFTYTVTGFMVPEGTTKDEVAAKIAETISVIVSASTSENLKNDDFVKTLIADVDFYGKKLSEVLNTYTLTVEEPTVETKSLSICETMITHDGEDSYFQTSDYYKFSKVKFTSCEVTYNATLGENEDEVKSLIVDVLTKEYEKYIASLNLRHEYVKFCEKNPEATTDEAKAKGGMINVFLDSLLEVFQTNILTTFTLENDKFQIDEFQFRMLGDTWDSEDYFIIGNGAGDSYGYVDWTLLEYWEVW